VQDTPQRLDMPTLRQQSLQGFTLIEAVVAIAITGIVAGIVALFLRIPVQGYVNSAERIELVDTADVALRRMTRDLRLALPNSIRTKTNGIDQEYIEFLLTKTGGRYLAEEDDDPNGKPLSFTSETDLEFDIVGPVPTDAQAILKDDYIVVYNLGEHMGPADAYGNCPSSCNIAQVAKTPTDKTVELNANPFAKQSPAFPSPGRHFHVVSSPVTYVCNRTTRTLTRYSGYEISTVQPTVAALGSATSALLANDVADCSFSYENASGSLAAVRSGMVGLSLTLQKPAGNSGAITLFHQVHVDNTP
jgi:MSHA biogenesis protein MshO